MLTIIWWMDSCLTRQRGRKRERQQTCQAVVSNPSWRLQADPEELKVLSSRKILDPLTVAANMINSKE